MNLIERIVIRLSYKVAAIKKKALLSRIAKLGQNVSIGDYTLIQNTDSLSVGSNTQIGDFTVLLAQNTITIGERCRISTSCMITSVTHKIPSLDRHTDDFVAGKELAVVIGDNVWIGATCVVLPGTTIGDNSIISAGSVIKGIVPPNQIWGGTPAVYISTIRF